MLVSKWGNPHFDLLLDCEHSGPTWCGNIPFQTHASDFLSGLVPFNDIYPLVAFAREKYAPFHWSINLSKKWWGKETYHGNLYQKGFRKHPSHPPLVVNLTYLYCDSYEAVAFTLVMHLRVYMCIFRNRKENHPRKLKENLTESLPLWDNTSDFWQIFPSPSLSSINR